MDLLIGTYSQPILFGTGKLFQGKGKGLYLCAFDGESITVRSVLPMMNPSFLAVDEDRGRIYAVNEGKEFHGAYGGGITEVRLLKDGTLREEQSLPTQGTDPCHVAIQPGKHWVGVANYADGSVSFFALDAQGCLSGRCEHFQHEGPEPHAHSVLFDGEGTYAYAVDLGNDMLMRYDLTETGVIMNPEQSLRVAPGSGPRTGLFHDHGRHLYVIHERASAVSHFVRGPEGYIQESMISTLLPDSGCEANACSDLHITPDGKFLYAGNRGHDSITAFALSDSGVPERIGNYACHGKTPRNFAVSPDGKYVLIGNQDSDTIAVCRIQENGALCWIRNLDFPTPVCIRFLKDGWDRT